MGNRREIWLLLALVALILALAVLTGKKSEGGTFDLRTSTYLNGPLGARALHETLRGVHVPVGRRMEPYADADSLQGPLAVLSPTLVPSPGELHALAEWVRDGGTLIYAARPAVVSGRANTLESDAMADTLGLRLTPFGDRTRMTTLDPRRVGRAATVEPGPLTEGVGAVDGFQQGFATYSPALKEGHVLASTGGTPVVVDFRMGRGRVIAWSDGFPLSNTRLKDSRAGILFARTAADAARGRRIWFDEFHHGFQSGGNVVKGTVRFLLSERAGHAALQVAVALLGVLLLFGRRFGAPVPPPPARRRSPLEHVEALAGAYRQAGARDTARRLLMAGLARRLGRRAPVDGAAEGELLRRLAAHPTAGGAAGAVQEEWKKGRGADLLALSRDVDRYIDEVNRT
jgi:hypothetical protein